MAQRTCKHCGEVFEHEDEGRAQQMLMNHSKNCPEKPQEEKGGGEGEEPPVKFGTPAGEVEQYPTEPVERLRQILLANGGKEDIVERVVHIFKLSMHLYMNPENLDSLLRTHFSFKGNENWVRQVVMQFITGVQPQGGQGSSGAPYPFPQGSQRGFQGYPPVAPSPQVGFQGYPPLQPQGYPGYPGGGTQPQGEDPELQQLRQENEQLRQQIQQNEREKEEYERQRLDNRISSIEEKLNKLTSGGQDQSSQSQTGRTMTIYDENNNPIQMPYDPSIADAIRRKEEARAEREKFEQWKAMAGNQGDSGSSKEIQELRSRLDQAIKERNDEERKRLEAKIEEANRKADAAASSNKKPLDYVQEMGEGIREEMQGARQDIKGIAEQQTQQGGGGNQTGTGSSEEPQEPKSPNEIANQMESENEFIDQMEGRS